MNSLRSPFTTRPIEDPSLFFGRSDEISEVIKRIKHSQPLSTILIGGRKIGKTSFINQLRHSIVKRYKRIIYLHTHTHRHAEGNDLKLINVF